MEPFVLQATVYIITIKGDGFVDLAIFLEEEGWGYFILHRHQYIFI